MRGRPVLVLLALTALPSCENPLESCPPATSLAGSWAYVAKEDAPGAADIAGTLTVTTESCRGFQGRLDVVETDPSGRARRLTGLVSGRLVGSASGVRLEAFFDQGARLHLAELGGDSLAGSWLTEAIAGSPAATGRFVSHRQKRG